jgi:hypothetical protein
MKTQSPDAVSLWIEASREKVKRNGFAEEDLDQLAGLIEQPRQLVLYLYSKSTNMRSPLASWMLFDPTRPQEPALQNDEPPYGSVIEAMADGWRVVQFPVSKLYSYEDVDNDYLGYEFILEKLKRTR